VRFNSQKNNANQGLKIFEIESKSNTNAIPAKALIATETIAFAGTTAYLQPNKVLLLFNF